MAAWSEKVRILLIRPWTEPLAPLRAVLRDAGIPAQIFRVDIEPALNAALHRGGFDVVIFDPKMPGISREAVETRLREHRSSVPIITLDELDAIPSALEQVLAKRMN